MPDSGQEEHLRVADEQYWLEVRAHLRVADEQYWLEVRAQFDQERDDRARVFIESEEIVELWTQSEREAWQTCVDSASGTWNELREDLVDAYIANHSAHTGGSDPSPDD